MGSAKLWMHGSKEKREISLFCERECIARPSKHACAEISQNREECPDGNECSATPSPALHPSVRQRARTMRGVRQYTKDGPLNPRIDDDNDNEGHEQCWCDIPPRVLGLAHWIQGRLITAVRKNEQQHGLQPGAGTWLK